MAFLAFASATFLGTHFLLSHPLRTPLVSRMGEGPFRGLYSLVALITFGIMVWAYRRAGDQQPLWLPGDTSLLIATVLMWLGAILFVGSFIGNPALAGARRPNG